MTRRRTPLDIVQQRGHARIERAPRKTRKVGSAFWTAAELPDFTKLPGLIRLTMYRTLEEAQLPELFHRVGQCDTLEDLALVHCKLSALPDDLTPLRRLYALRIEGTAIATLPESVGALDRLEELWLLESPVRALPDALGAARKLRMLRVGGSPLAPAPLRQMPALDGATELEQMTLADLPELEDAAFLGRLPSLRALELAGRVAARGLPEELATLTSLRALALRRVAEIPRAIAGLRALEVLYLVGDTCTRAPAWLPELASLRYLAVFGNRELDATSIVEAAAAMPRLARIFLPYPFDDGARERLERLGFATNRSNPSVMERATDEGPVEDPFPFVR